MALLDDILLGNRRARGQRSFVDTLESSSVVNMGERGIQFSVPDTRASTALARDVLLETIGYVPQGFGRSATRPIAFEEGSPVRQTLLDKGIGVGSSLQDVSRALTGQEIFNGADGEGRNLSALLSSFLGSTGNTRGQEGNLEGSTSEPIQAYLDSYRRGNNDGIPDDLKKIIDFLDQQDITFDQLTAPRRRR